MNSTTITIGLVVLALAVGAWILLRGGKEEDDEEEVEAGAVSAPPAPAKPVPTPPTYNPAAAEPGRAPPAPAYGTATPVYSAPPPTSVAPFTTEGHAYDVRARWQELQLRFVDDPQSAAGEAERLIDDALAGVTASLNARKDQLNSWRVSGRDDTEQLRAAVHGYRDFLNHLVGP